MRVIRVVPRAVLVSAIITTGCGGSGGSEPLVSDKAFVLGPPISRGTDNYPAYPVFVKGAKVHAWLDARDLDHPLNSGGEVDVSYYKSDIKSASNSLRTLSLKPSTAKEK